jgi:hypothetical protein
MVLKLGRPTNVPSGPEFHKGADLEHAAIFPQKIALQATIQDRTNVFSRRGFDARDADVAGLHSS